MITRTTLTVVPASRSSLRPVREKPRKLHDLVVEALGAQILSGQMAEGEVMMAEQTMAERLGVSRSVLRTALSKLQDKGLLEIRHGRGAWVASPQTWDLLDADVLRWLADVPPHTDATLGEDGVDLHDATREFTEAVLALATRLRDNPLFTCLMRRLDAAGYAPPRTEGTDAHPESEH